MAAHRHALDAVLSRCLRQCALADCAALGGERELRSDRRRPDVYDRAARSRARVRRTDQGEAVVILFHRRHGSLRDLARLRPARKGNHVPLSCRAESAGLAGLAARLTAQARREALYRMAALAYARPSAKAGT